jgi:type IV pilus assembly protein PilC
MGETYRYKALDSSGKLTSGELEAEDRVLAIETLRSGGLTLLQLEASTPASSTSQDSSTGFSFELFGVAPESIAFFTRQLAELTDAGLPILESLESLENLTPSPTLRRTIRAISHDVAAGQGLFQAFSRHEDIFSPLYLNMLKVAEATGELHRMLASLAEHLEFELETRGKLKAALTYPVFILVFCVLLVWGMISFLLPSFMPMWQNAKLDLHQYPITLALMKVAEFTNGSVLDDLLFLALAAGLVYGFRKLLDSPAGQQRRDSFVYHLPGLRAVVRLSLMTRVSHTLSVLLGMGMPLHTSLDLVAQTSGNTVVQAALSDVSLQVQKGGKLSAAFAESRVFPPLAVQMVGIAERTGDLTKTFTRLAAYYHGQLDAAIRAFLSLLEPFTMVVIGGVVFVFVLGVFLPIMGVVAAMQNNM